MLSTTHTHFATLCIFFIPFVIPFVINSHKLVKHERHLASGSALKRNVPTKHMVSLYVTACLQTCFCVWLSWLVYASPGAKRCDSTPNARKWFAGWKRVCRVDGDVFVAFPVRCWTCWFIRFILRVAWGLVSGWTLWEWEKWLNAIMNFREWILFNLHQFMIVSHV